MLAPSTAGPGPTVADPWSCPHPEDLGLAAAAAAGDPAASEAFVRRAFPVVRRVARAIIAEPAEADDAVQLALIEVLEAARTYRGTGKLEPWMRTVASRAVLRYARKARSSRVHALDEAQPGPARPPAGTTVLESLPRPLEHYLGELPPAQRTAIVLRHALGHTIAEIAEITAAPVPTVLSRIKKAREHMRRLIQRDVNLGVRPIERTS
ncbi:MAG: sigma-70 family RNA polymerase sigma factor [Nannocystaceae bacterium]